MACEGSPHVFHYSAVEDQYWYRDDQQWYICESQPCPHRHLSFNWTQEEWAGFPAYRKTHPNQSQLIEARLNQPPPAPVARPPRPAVVASRSLPGTQPPSRIPSRVPSRNVTPSESPKLGPSGLPPGLELVRQRLASSPARSPIASTSKLPEAEVKPEVKEEPKPATPIPAEPKRETINLNTPEPSSPSSSPSAPSPPPS